MRVFLKAHNLISSGTLSSLHTEILHVIPGSGRLKENHRIKTDLEGCQHDGNGCTMHLPGCYLESRCHLYPFLHSCSRTGINRGENNEGLLVTYVLGRCMGRNQPALDNLPSAHRNTSGLYQHFSTAQVV